MDAEFWKIMYWYNLITECNCATISHMRGNRIGSYQFYHIFHTEGVRDRIRQIFPLFSIQEGWDSSDQTCHYFLYGRIYYWFNTSILDLHVICHWTFFISLLTFTSSTWPDADVDIEVDLINLWIMTMPISRSRQSCKTIIFK